MKKLFLLMLVLVLACSLVLPAAAHAGNESAADDTETAVTVETEEVQEGLPEDADTEEGTDEEEEAVEEEEAEEEQAVESEAAEEEEEAVEEEAAEDPDDEGEEEESAAPLDSPLVSFLKSLFEKIDLFFTLNPEAKARKLERIAERRLEELAALSEGQLERHGERLAKAYAKAVAKAEKFRAKTERKAAVSETVYEGVYAEHPSRLALQRALAKAPEGSRRAEALQHALEVSQMGKTRSEAVRQAASHPGPNTGNGHLKKAQAPPEEAEDDATEQEEAGIEDETEEEDADDGETAEEEGEASAQLKPGKSKPKGKKDR